MNLDGLTLAVATTVVVSICGILFLIETLQRRDEGAGRLWAIAFVLTMISIAAWLMWAAEPDAWWVNIIGSAGFVGSNACIWLGCRRFNRRPMTWSIVFGSVLVIAAAMAVLVEGSDGGPWAGGPVMYVTTLLVSALGAIECLRDDLGRTRTSWMLSVALTIQALFFVARLTAFFVAGPDSEVFVWWFGTPVASLLAMAFSIIVVVATSVLRAQRAPIRGYERRSVAGVSPEGLMDQDFFRVSLASLVARAATRTEVVAVAAVRIEDLDQISTAFGSDVARDIRDEWIAAVRRGSATAAMVAIDGVTRLLIATLVDSAATARRQTAAMDRELFDDLRGVSGGVIPVTGTGLVTTETEGYDADGLIAAAHAAARRAVHSGETMLVVDDVS